MLTKNKNNTLTVCQEKLCNGCMACVDKCPKGAISIIDDLETYNAKINIEKCVNCGLCEKTCPRCIPTQKRKPISWNQGWAKDENIRAIGSSGGVASALARAFIKSGGVVCSCVFQNGEFGFEIIEFCEEIKKISGSKYVKSNPRGIYRKIEEKIKARKKVLFIGLPCQSAGVQNYIGESEFLYTVDLICHGTPSPKLLEYFLEESGFNLGHAKTINFRKKEDFHVSYDEDRIAKKTVMDRYMMSFLKSVNYTENCYFCDYAEVNRVSDITLGDSWGSELPKEEREKGVSLILCQTDKGRELLNIADLYLCDVDCTNAIQNNKQLISPSEMPKEKELFFKELKKSQNFKKSVAKVYPKYCFRQDIKELLIKLGIIKI